MEYIGEQRQLKKATKSFSESSSSQSSSNSYFSETSSRGASKESDAVQIYPQNVSLKLRISNLFIC